MQKNQMDEGLNFKKRARRRLVGAIALVFLMIIILPMILKDREESVSQEEIEIIMPDQDPVELAEDVGIDPKETVEVMPDENVSAEAVDLPKPKKPTTSPAKKAAETAKPKPTQKPKPKPVPKEAVKPVEVKKAPVKKEPVKQKAEKVTVVSDKFYVQIGVFSEVANVKKLQSKLSDLGYQSVTEKITTDKGVKTRLRTETFVGRNEAVIALENIKDSGLTGMVVNQK